MSANRRRHALATLVFAVLALAACERIVDLTPPDARPPDAGVFPSDAGHDGLGSDTGGFDAAVGGG